MEHERRDHADADTGRRIEDLIARASDPVQQATLIVLSRMNTSLDSNTTATCAIADELRRHRTDFQEHDKQELRRMSWLQGAWWAIAAMFVAIAGLTGYNVREHLEGAKTMNAELAALQIRLKVVEVTCKVP